MNDFESWRSFEYQKSSVQLWVFKKSSTKKRYRAWHVRTDEDIESLFRETIVNEIGRITETLDYTVLSQNHENSCLRHNLEDSDGMIALLTMVDAPETENTDAKLKHLKGATGYLVKFQQGNETVYAIRKTTKTWKPKIRSSIINAVFQNGELSTFPSESFSFDSFFDMYCFNETLFIASKISYESLASDKAIYKKSFDDLGMDAIFLSTFNNINALKAYVGTNAIQLRRMTVVQQKELYKRPNFSESVRLISTKRGWGIEFDDDGKIIVSEKTVKVIVQVLLDHRLLSEITDVTYDVPDAQAV